MQIGIISDTHGHVPNAVHDALAGVDHILHAGAVGPVDVITELEAIAPVTAVRGNTDSAINLPETRLIEFGGKKFLIHHIVDFSVPSNTVRTLLAEEQPQVVVFGHTHMPFCETLGGVLFLNPGSVTQPRGDYRPSMVRLIIDHGKITPKFIEF